MKREEKEMSTEIIDWKLREGRQTLLEQMNFTGKEKKTHGKAKGGKGTMETGKHGKVKVIILDELYQKWKKKHDKAKGKTETWKQENRERKAKGGKGKQMKKGNRETGKQGRAGKRENISL